MGNVQTRTRWPGGGTGAQALVALLCVSATVSVDAQQPEVLGDVSAIVPASIRVSADGRHVALVTVDGISGKRRVNVDGRASAEAFDSIAQGTPLVTADGAHVAYVAQSGKTCAVIADGVSSPAYLVDGPAWPVADLLFSPDGRYLAYKVRMDGKTVVVVNGKAQGRFDDAEDGHTWGVWDFTFSPDGEWFAFRARQNGKMGVWSGRSRSGPRDGEARALGMFDSVGSGTPVSGVFNGEESFYYIASADKGESLRTTRHRDWKVGPFEEVLRGSVSVPPFARHRVDCVARRGGGVMPVMGGEVRRVCDEVTPCVYGPPSNTLYVIREGARVTAVINGTEGPAWDGIQCPRAPFSPDGRVTAYVAVFGGRAAVVTNHAPQAWFGSVDVSSVTFSPDGRRLAYVAGAPRPALVLDGRAGRDEFDAASGLTFSTDSRRFACRVRRGTRWLVQADGRETGPYDTLSPGSPCFGPDGRLVYAAMSNGVWRVYVEHAAGPVMQALVGAFTFNPRGGELTYVARLAGQGRSEYAVVVDQHPLRRHEAIWLPGEGGVAWSPDGVMHYLSRDRLVVTRWTWRPGKGGRR